MVCVGYNDEKKNRSRPVKTMNGFPSVLPEDGTPGLASPGFHHTVGDNVSVQLQYHA